MRTPPPPRRQAYIGTYIARQPRTRQSAAATASRSGERPRQAEAVGRATWKGNRAALIYAYSRIFAEHCFGYHSDA